MVDPNLGLDLLRLLPWRFLLLGLFMIGFKPSTSKYLIEVEAGGHQGDLAEAS